MYHYKFLAFPIVMRGGWVGRWVGGIDHIHFYLDYWNSFIFVKPITSDICLRPAHNGTH